MTDRRRASGQSGQSGQEDNPYAPPPADAPDQPWQPRQPGQQDGEQESGEGSGEEDGERSARSKWGSQWSSRQPRRGGGEFGNGKNSDDEAGKGSGKGNRLRWDPKDPAQRHARYALLAGMWSFFFALFNFPPIALLLGALALYWGISSLRGAPWINGGKDKTSGDEGRRPPAMPDAGNGQKGPTGKTQRSAAIVGLVVGSLGLAVVLSTFTVQLVYKEYYDCVEDSLTTTSRAACEEHLPERLRSLLGED